LKTYYENPSMNEHSLLAKLTDSDDNGNKLSETEIVDNMKVSSNFSIAKADFLVYADFLVCRT
jgi:hypothetical protein